MKIFEKLKTESIIKKGLTSSAIKLMGALSSYVLTYLIAIKYGAEGNGVFAIYMTYAVIFSTVFYLGLDIFLIKQVAVLISQRRYADLSNLYFKIVKSYIIPFSILLFILSATLFFYSNYVLMAFICSGIALNIIIDLNSAVLQGTKRVEWYSFFTQFAKYFFTVLLVALPFVGNGSYTVILLYLLSLSLNAILSSTLVLSILRKSDRTDDSQSTYQYSIKSIIASSKAFFISSIIIISLVWIDFIFIDFFLSKEAAGIYSVALKIATLISFGFTSFNAFLAPSISELYSKGKKKELQKMLSKNFILIFPMILLPFLAILLFHNQFLGFFGEEFTSGGIILILLAAGQLINSFMGPVSFLLQMTNHQKLFQNILILTLIVKTVSAFLFVKLFGVEGIALSSFIGLTMWTLVGSYFVTKKLGIYSFFTVSDLKSIFLRT